VISYLSIDPGSELWHHISTQCSWSAKTMPALNKNNSAVKRIMQEARELANDPCTDYHAAPLEDDIFEWHCTLRGPAGTEFEGGLYHFRIVLPAEYPFRPPSLMMLTPNGRFELNTKICISFTNYHEEEWQPAWGVRTAILGLQGFFPLKGQAATGVGSVEYPVSERKRLAQLSREWTCHKCHQCNLDHLPDPEDPPQHSSASPPSLPLPATLAEQLIEDSSSAPVIPTPDPESDVIEEITTQPRLRGTMPFTRPSSHRPPLILDTAICVLLVLVLALLCRRVLWWGDVLTVLDSIFLGIHSGQSV